MDILIATDDRFVDKYIVTLISLFENNKSNDICIHLIMDNLLSKAGLKKIEQIIVKYQQQLKIWHLDEESKKVLEGINFSKWGTPTIYRLLALSILEDVERFLWIDGDVIVQKDLKSFIEQPFEDNYIVACRDIAFTKAYRTGVLNHISGLENDIYYNAGISLYNLKKIQEDNVVERMWAWTREHAKELIYPDQDIMNVIFNGKIKANDPLDYNCQAGSLHWSEAKELMARASIIHYVGTKPWDRKYRKKLSSAIPGGSWWKYATKYRAWKKQYLEWLAYQIVCIYPWNAIYMLYWICFARNKDREKTI